MTFHLASWYWKLYALLCQFFIHPRSVRYPTASAHSVYFVILLCLLICLKSPTCALSFAETKTSFSPSCLSLHIFPSSLSSSVFLSYLFTFLQLSVELLSSCLHIQVVSVAEYHRRIDALNSEELRTLCRRLQVPSSVV